MYKRERVRVLATAVSHLKGQVHKGVQDVVILLLETFVPVGVGLGHDRIQHGHCPLCFVYGVSGRHQEKLLEEEIRPLRPKLLSLKDKFCALEKCVDYVSGKHDELLDQIQIRKDKVITQVM